MKKDENKEEKKEKKTLRELREEKGINREQMGEEIFIHPQTIFNYEIGKTEPGISVAYILAKYFDRNVDEIEWNPQKKPSSNIKKH